jgi:DNA-binding NarL/FixJ family response regulator
LAASKIQVLVVDDYEPWRRFVCSTLEEYPEFQVSGEVSDGLEAVQKAQELQADLILLDIGLPTLNGIEVARRIRGLSPKSKILFVSQESSPDVVEEALSFGEGYVIKAQAANELLTAVKAVVHGKHFVGTGVRLDLTAPHTPEKSHKNAVRGCPLVADTSEGMFRVDMDVPMPVDLPEDEQIRRILNDTYIADCNDALARMYGLDSAKDLIGRRMAEMVVPDDSKNIDLTRQFIRSGYQVLHRRSYELDVHGKPKVFLNSMTGVVVEGRLTTTLGRQLEITGVESLDQTY